MKSLYAFIFTLFLMPTAHSTSNIDIREWSVPWPQTRPRDPFVSPQGQVWFCGQAGNYLATLDPKTGAFKQYAVPDGSHPHNLIIDAKGKVWYAGNRNAHIGKLDPVTGDLTRYDMPGQQGDPHTLVFDAHGDIWFTLQWANQIGKLNTKTGAVKLIDIPIPNARPYGIKRDSQNRPWVVLFGTHRLATVDPQSFTLKLIDLPNHSARPRRLEITRDSIWMVDYRNGLLSQYHPTTQQFNHWPLPGGAGSLPYGTALDDQARIWIAQTGSQPNLLVVFDTKTKQFVAQGVIPSGGGTLRHMVFDAATDAVWFGTDTNFVGRGILE